MHPKAISKLHAKTCKAFSNPYRIEIIEALMAKECTTEELAHKMATSSPNVSQHLKIMRDRGVVASNRHDGKIWHRLASEKIRTLFLLEREILLEMHQKNARVVNENSGVSL